MNMKILPVPYNDIVFQHDLKFKDIFKKSSDTTWKDWMLLYPIGESAHRPRGLEASEAARHACVEKLKHHCSRQQN